MSQNQFTYNEEINKEGKIVSDSKVEELANAVVNSEEIPSDVIETIVKMFPDQFEKENKSEKKINVNNLVQSITNNEENIKLDNNESKDCYDCEDRKECNDNSNINKIINILFI